MTDKKPLETLEARVTKLKKLMLNYDISCKDIILESDNAEFGRTSIFGSHISRFFRKSSAIKAENIMRMCKVLTMILRKRAIAKGIKDEQLNKIVITPNDIMDYEKYVDYNPQQS